MTRMSVGGPPLEPARALAVAVAAGLVLGVVTQVGQSLLPEGVGQLANSISPWVSVAFFVGALQSSTRGAVAAGFLTLALASSAPLAGSGAAARSGPERLRRHSLAVLG